MNDTTKVVKDSGKRKPPAAGKGRPRGAKNKISGSIKEMIFAALAEAGGTAYIARQAEENPTAFLSLLGRLVPSELRAELSGAFTVETSFDEVMAKAVLIRGGLPDWQDRLETQIGRLFLKHQRGEKLPDNLVIGGLESDETGH